MSEPEEATSHEAGAKSALMQGLLPVIPTIRADKIQLSPFNDVDAPAPQERTTIYLPVMASDKRMPAISKAIGEALGQETKFSGNAVTLNGTMQDIAEKLDAAKFAAAYEQASQAFQSR